jgi:3,4-dihydroxy 2-butanone 4-phosphate synthase/GTP cyclohydrolase II
MPLCSLEEALDDLRAGKFLIVVDNEGRENEGDLVMPAEKVTPEAVNFMVKHARGLLCMPIVGERLDELGLPLLISNHPDQHGTAFTMSVDYRRGTTAGISGYDRAATIRAMIDPNAGVEDFTRPGHLFPLRYNPGGVLVRPGHTEAIVDLCRIAGFYPTGVVCEVLNDDGTMARLTDLEMFAQRHGLRILSIDQIIYHRLRHEKFIEGVAEARLPTKYGKFKVHAYKSPLVPGEHLALTIGQRGPEEPLLVRLQRECLSGDVFGSLHCNCGEQTRAALEILAREGKGIFIYVRQGGHECSWGNKVHPHSPQGNGLGNLETTQSPDLKLDLRRYALCTQILRDLGVRKLRLLTNHPAQDAGLSGLGLEVIDWVPLTLLSEEKTGLVTMEGRRPGN